MAVVGDAFYGVFLCCPFSHEMSWMKFRTELSQFLRVFLPYLPSRKKIKPALLLSSYCTDRSTAVHCCNSSLQLFLVAISTLPFIYNVCDILSYTVEHQEYNSIVFVLENSMRDIMTSLIPKT